MTDVTVAESGPAVADAAEIISIPVVKAKESIDIDVKRLPDNVYAEVIFQGLKQVLNRNQTKLVAKAYSDAEAKKAGYDSAAAHLHADALKASAKNLEEMYAGKIRSSSGTKSTKLSGEVKDEAMRLARTLVKQAIKSAKGKVGDYAASEITKAAKVFLERDPSIVAMAQKNVEERNAKKIEGVNLAQIISVSADRVKAREDKAAKAKAKKADKAPLSAAKAGQTQTRAKPQGATAH